MIAFDKFILNNGLRVIVHQDFSTPLAAVNILYDVGARDEDPEKTGFAHLFEHLMFGGSLNIPHFDTELQKAGGVSNAFTSNDLTNYYISIPSVNLETAFWLESDRMMSLAFSEKSLEVQRNVVVEEFRQRYLNQPYGDVWLLLRPLAYKSHPYQWPTIGRCTDHISGATMDDVRSFFRRHYKPDNAILTVAGNVAVHQVKELCEKWFSEIPSGGINTRALPIEPPQMEKRVLPAERDVPGNALYMCFHMSERNSSRYYAADLISDLLSRGKSSRLYHSLVKRKKLFSEIDAYLTGSMDAGLFVISGRLSEEVSMDAAENAVWEEINKIKVFDHRKELAKVKNKVESSWVFSEMDVLNRAMSLSMYELMGDASEINSEIGKYNAVNSETIRQEAGRIFRESNCSALYYRSVKPKA